MAVELKLQQASVSEPPFGLVDTPAQNATGLHGSIGVTGWTLDDVGVAGVRIYRNCLTFEPVTNCAFVHGAYVVLIGDATMVADARPDIEALYPTYPQANRAGWGYLLLTNTLPHEPNQQMFGGQGTITLSALATDAEGKQTWLGRTGPADTTPTTITLANDTIAEPFGAIDTPQQGETVSGALYNYGWSLTPDSNTTSGDGDTLIPVNSSTQWVLIDGLPVALVTSYNECRGSVGNPVPTGLYCDDDVANTFGNPTPQAVFTSRSSNPTKYRNLDAERGAIGWYRLDTTTLTNGRHEIAWGVTDSAGRSAGIGSRYFFVLNAAADAAPLLDAPIAAVDSALPFTPTPLWTDAALLDSLTPATGRVWGRTGFDMASPYAIIGADAAGVRHVQIDGLSRVEVWLGPVDRGYLVSNGMLRDLPSGSHLDPATGQFTWAPTVGFIGTYRLAFVRGDEHFSVVIAIQPTESTVAGNGAIRVKPDRPWRDGYVR